MILDPLHSQTDRGIVAAVAEGELTNDSYDFKNIDPELLELLQYIAAAPPSSKYNARQTKIRKFFGFVHVPYISHLQIPEINAVIEKEILVSPLMYLRLKEANLLSENSKLVIRSLLDSRILNVLRGFNAFDRTTSQYITLHEAFDLVINFPALRYYYSRTQNCYLADRRQSRK